jgi:hypothetical protein
MDKYLYIFEDGEVCISDIAPLIEDNLQIDDGTLQVINIDVDDFEQEPELKIRVLGGNTQSSLSDAVVVDNRYHVPPSR